ncbi:hypothetical protein ABL78_1901 [Leptomonas seymouri]|uniref:PSP1 C-terminal domain-containing protein n=1 Tax=Leptomonas seymouri TaxID=5684 RepID=A0A0N0P823_LEPSE|nr:hypothetical protein ABL78_1901 [Leptomonas seymouri]|eukprot:KPI89017.1 hypothetical protein ABL78_1901 [Leptomonas seymouri]
MPVTASNQAMDKEQLASIVRKLMIDADDFFVRQQKTLQLSYAELNGRIDQLRMRIQQQQKQQQQHQMQQDTAMSSNSGVYSSMNPSPFSVAHSLLNGDMMSISGTGQALLGGGNGNAGSGSTNVNATPLRTTSSGSMGYGAVNSSANNDAARSLICSLNGPSPLLTMGDAALETGRFGSATTVAAGGFMSGATVNGSALMGGVRGAFRDDGASPPNKQLALSQSSSKSPSMPQQQHGTVGLMKGSDVYDDPITGEYSFNAPNSNSNMGGSHNGSLMASPQSTQKLSLEELIERFNMSTSSVNAATTGFNFDSLYEQLTGGGPEESLESPLNYTDNGNGQDVPTSHAASPYDRSYRSAVVERDDTSPDATAFGSTAAKNSIPVDSLRAVHDQHLTTSVRVAYEQGRPKVISIPGGAADSPESLGINPRSSCEVLVEFKRKRVLQYESNEYVAPGSYVIVGGDRGEDLGLVVYAWCEVSNDGGKCSGGGRGALSASEHSVSGSGKRKVVGVGLTDCKLPRSMGVGNGTVLRLASDIDVQQLLGTQAELERRAIDVCAQLVLDHSLPMVIVDAEYQFDKKKLTFFYEAQQRMDFRELVRHLYKTFRARIWMELVDA